MEEVEKSTEEKIAYFDGICHYSHRSTSLHLQGNQGYIFQGPQVLTKGIYCSQDNFCHRGHEQK